MERTEKVRPHVYVDAFNLYYGALKGSRFKWLNLRVLSDLLLPQHDVRSIKYFTALVSAWPHDPDQPQRQQLYLRALRTLPEVEIIYGHYLSHAVWMPLACTTGTQPEKARVIKTEEKGSDVNLATHLLCDAFADQYDTAVIISNDSDLLLPIQIVRSRFGKKIGILNPHRHHPSRALLPHVDFVKTIRKGVLAASQFPPTLRDNLGEFHKPPTW